MGKIRKYTTFANRELLDKGDFNGIHFTFGNVERTACRCGYVSQGKIYECPECKNSKFLYDVSYDKSISESKYDIEIIGRDFAIFNYKVGINFGVDLSLKEEKKVIISYEKGILNLPRWGNEFSEIGFPIMMAHINELPSNIVLALDQIGKYKNLDASVFTSLINAGPNLKQLIKNEDTLNPLFVGATISRFIGRGYGSTVDVPYVNMQQCCNNYRIPEEFHELLGKIPSVILERIPYYGTSQFFDSGRSWHLVQKEIKNIAWYYYENGIIDFKDYLSLGNVNEDIILKTDLISSFFKKYMMQFQNGIVNKLNEVYAYLITNGITVDKTTLDYKFYFQHKNVATIKENVARSEFDIDNFINGLSVNAVDAMKILASTKRIKKV